MDEETSEGELLSFRVLEVGASKRKRRPSTGAFWKFSSLRRLRQRWKHCWTKAGPIDHFAPFAASSAKTTGGMEMELATK